ncbi:hypothetical protein D6827_03570, partial [Candidatus Parcubacteria bacterium]
IIGLPNDCIAYILVYPKNIEKVISELLPLIPSRKEILSRINNSHNFMKALEAEARQILEIDY